MGGFFRTKTGRYFKRCGSDRDPWDDRVSLVGLPSGKKGDGEKNKVKIEIEQGSPTSDRPARVLVYQGEKLVAEIIATVELGRGCHYEMSDYVALKIEKH
ncbi:MAG: hypothetical protein M1334_03365 [Patescibacteria group bacterium]|nr:hypothetical protein [Patescibacteria group bacterium]